ncbi:MAG: hypothetical protein HUU21_28510 [Polyangiaceae bacterium]|nr:hypothetical protein [Polyangiaceae bacterium]
MAQLSGTMIMLTEAGELGLARAVHEAIGKMLIRSDDQEAARDGERRASFSG